MKYTFKIIPKNQMQSIQPLWEKLNRIHGSDSRYFKEHYAGYTFEKRCEKFMETAASDIRIEIIESDQTPLGYCIATVKQSTGEIDSLFIEEDHRGYSLGRQLMEKSIRWLKEEKHCETILVSVAEGHEAVFDFYRKLGFYPRLTWLQLKPDKGAGNA